MKRNILLEGLTKFLIPVVTLYSIFLIARYLQEGLFTIFYSILLIAICAIIYFSARQEIHEVKLIFSLKIAIWLFFFITFFYLISVFILLASQS